MSQHITSHRDDQAAKNNSSDCKKVSCLASREQRMEQDEELTSLVDKRVLPKAKVEMDEPFTSRLL